jgi:methionyl-tRNA formyltransferase
MNKIKIVFAGTSEFAVPFIEGLFDDNLFVVVGVITQSDKPTGRKQEITQSAVKVAAQNHNVKVWQPVKLRLDTEITNEIRATGADMLVVVAYGQIIPKEILDLFPFGAINVHPSLLPKYRGASPIQSAILNGENKTGISIMLMDEKMDHGYILMQEEISLDGTETNKSLHETLAESGAPLLIEVIKKYLTKEILGCEQKHELATFCKTINKEDARIDWNKTAQEINNTVRGFYPWPVAWTTLDTKRLKIFPPVEVVDAIEGGSVGQIKIFDGQILIQCGKDALRLNKLQIEGKKEMLAKEVVNGFKDLDEKILE